MENQKRRKLAESPKTKATEQKCATCQGDEATEILTDKVFSISLVTDCIFNHISFPDLLSSCTLVSKNWNSAVKDYLRRRRTCLFKCNLDDFNELENQLQILKNPGLNNCHLFSGINLFITPKSAELKQRESSSRESILSELFSLIDPTHIVLTLKDHENDMDLCRQYPHLEHQFKSRVDKLISNVLFRLLASYDIHHLSFKGKLHGFSYDWKLWLKNVGPRGFATLETIRPIISLGTSNDFNTWLCAFPNLTDIPTDVPVEELATFDKYNKLPLVQHLTTNADFSDTIFKLGTNNFEMLTKMQDFLVTIRLNECFGGTPEEYKLMGRIIQLHSNSLRRIELRSHARVVGSYYDNIFQLNFPPLPLAKEVHIVYTVATLSSHESYLKFKNHPHLKRIFPNARVSTSKPGKMNHGMFHLLCYFPQ